MKLESNFLLQFKSRGSVLFFFSFLYILHVQILHTTYSGGHESFVNIIKNTGGGWQLFQIKC